MGVSIHPENRNYLIYSVLLPPLRTHGELKGKAAWLCKEFHLAERVWRRQNDNATRNIESCLSCTVPS